MSRSPVPSPSPPQQARRAHTRHQAPSRRAQSRWWVVLGLTALTGCELGGNLEDLAQELGNPGSETVEVGGRQIAEGQFRDLRFDGTSADGAFVLAVKDGGELNVIPFSGAEGCSIDGVSSYRSALVRDESVALDARLPILRPAEGDRLRRLQFINFACDVMDVEVSGAGLPLNSSFTEDPGYIVQTDDDSLVFVDPWSQQRRLIADGVSEIADNRLALFREGDGDEDWMWTLEAGELVARDRNFEEITRGGSNVTGVRFSTLEGEAIVILTENSRALSWAPRQSLSDQTPIVEDACGLSVGTGNAGRELRYYQPCDDRKLWAHELVTNKRWEYVDGVRRFSIAGSTDEGPIIMYLTDPAADNSRVGTLWVQWGQASPIRVAEDAHFSLSSLRDREIRTVREWTGTGGELVIGELGDDLEPFAKGVAYFSSIGLIHNFDGEQGELATLDDDGSLTPVAENVSLDGIRIDSALDRALFMTDVSGGEGTLVLLEDGIVRPLSDQVRPGSYQFTALLPTVTVLSHILPDTGTAELTLHWTERIEQRTISDGVAESVEVNWPEEGMLYSVTTEARRGIWFARMR